MDLLMILIFGIIISYLASQIIFNGRGSDSKPIRSDWAIKKIQKKYGYKKEKNTVQNTMEKKTDNKDKTI